jgi:hypothetical protein
MCFSLIATLLYLLDAAVEYGATAEQTVRPVHLAGGDNIAHKRTNKCLTLILLLSYHDGKAQQRAPASQKGGLQAVG